jgi:hypothetical protein
MINWCKQNTLLLLITSSFWSGQSSSVADSIATKGVECRNINAAYQKVHSFETENYYINICQLNSKFYYYRQSKLDANNNLLVPAESLVRGNVFQATAGKTTYFVGTDRDRYYSSVMSNNNEIIFEPEILSASSAFTQNLVQVSDRTALTKDYSLSELDNHSLSSAGLDLNHLEADSAQILICNPEQPPVHPFLTLGSTNQGRFLLHR